MFDLTEKQDERLETWMFEQDQKVIAEQKEDTDLECSDVPYYGTSGGGYTYSFTPTGLGVVAKVKNEITGNVIDLTDYNSW